MQNTGNFKGNKTYNRPNCARTKRTAFHTLSPSSSRCQRKRKLLHTCAETKRFALLASSQLAFISIRERIRFYFRTFRWHFSRQINGEEKTAFPSDRRAEGDRNELEFSDKHLRRRRLAAPRLRHSFFSLSEQMISFCIRCLFAAANIYSI